MITGGRVKKFLMCSPHIFDVQYVINPWMSGNVNNVSPVKANLQWLFLKTVLQSQSKIEIKSTAFIKERIPDIVFTANAGLVFGSKVILSSFFFDERKPEIKYFYKWFQELGYQTRSVSHNFEGAGDALSDNKGTLFIGTGTRTDPLVVDEIRDITEGFYGNIVEMQMANPNFYHLDTCFCPLDLGHLLVYEKAFSERSISLLKQLYEPESLIFVTEEDANSFSCNAISINDLVIANKFSVSLKEKLESVGYTTIETPLSEFIKAGGSAKCLTLELNPQ